MVEIPGVVDRTEMRDDAGAAIRELVHVELAEKHGARVAPLLHHRRIDIGYTIRVYRAGGGGAHTCRIDIVLERDRNAMQRATRTSRSGLGVERARLCQRLFGGHR